jgi:hypothetical protein
MFITLSLKHKKIAEINYVDFAFAMTLARLRHTYLSTQFREAFNKF